jgi:hypothetical protein
MGEMPSETIIHNDDRRLTVQWAKQDAADPTVLVTDWRSDTAPDGSCSDWTPLGSYDLDRSDINRLIRVLRRARDQAYGSDE